MWRRGLIGRKVSRMWFLDFGSSGFGNEAMGLGAQEFGVYFGAPKPRSKVPEMLAETGRGLAATWGGGSQG